MNAAAGEQLIVRAGGARLALPMDRIAEVRAHTSETPVPGTPPGIRGVVERNGAPVHVLDPAQRLFNTSVTLGSRACIVFFDDVAGHGAAAIVVDEVERIVERDDTASALDVDALFVIDPAEGP
jgi:purine-binding chemotaxis protein CheW